MEEQIRQRAYQLWEEAGWPEGDGQNFWLQAEAELSDCGSCKSTVEACQASSDSVLFVELTKAYKKEKVS